LQQIQVVNGVPPTGDYSFAKYNKVNAVSVFTFMPALHFSDFLSLLGISSTFMI